VYESTPSTQLAVPTTAHGEEAHSLTFVSQYVPL
jgi:hypothetical protein